MMSGSVASSSVSVGLLHADTAEAIASAATPSSPAARPRRARYRFVMRMRSIVRSEAEGETHDPVRRRTHRLEVGRGVAAVGDRVVVLRVDAAVLRPRRQVAPR